MATNSEMPSSRRTIMASEFKAKCLKLMDEVAETGEEIVITKNGKPVAKLAPYSEARPIPKSMFGKDKGKIRILGDIVSPMPAEWFTPPQEYENADPLVAPIPPDWPESPESAPGSPC